MIVNHEVTPYKCDQLMC